MRIADEVLAGGSLPLDLLGDVHHALGRQADTVRRKLAGLPNQAGRHDCGGRRFMDSAQNVSRSANAT
jgi:hypothetical protein